jgi:Sec-independent protein translocase protein TatA
MSGIGPTELVVILVIVVLLYALGRLPEFGGVLENGVATFWQAASKGKPAVTITSETDPENRVDGNLPKT